MLRTRAVLVAMLAAAASLLPCLAAAGAWTPARGEYYSEMYAFRNFSDTYYDSAGARFTVPQGGRFERRSFEFQNELGWKKRLSVAFGMPITSSTTNYRTIGVQQTETGFGDFDFGFKYKLMDGATALAIEAGIIVPLGYQTTTLAPLGSGEQLWRGRVWYGKTFPGLNAFLETSVSYLSPFKSGREQARAQVQAGAWVGSSVLLLGHYEYAQLLGGSSLASDDVRIQTVGPELRYRIDDKLDVFAGSQHIASGRGVLHSDGYYVGMAFRKSKHNRLQGLLGNKTQP